YELREEPRDARRALVGVRRHRERVRAQRQVRREAVERWREPGGDVFPQTAVRQDAVGEDERRPRACLPIPQPTVRQRDLAPRVEPHRLSHGPRPLPIMKQNTYSSIDGRGEAVKGY